MVRDEEKKVKNLEEHLRILKRDVSEKNTLLTQLIDSIDLRSKELSNLDEEIREKKLTILNLGEQSNSINFNVKGALSVLRNAEDRSLILNKLIESNLVKQDIVKRSIGEYERMLIELENKYAETRKRNSKFEKEYAEKENKLLVNIGKLETKKLVLLEDIESIQKNISSEKSALYKCHEDAKVEMDKIKKMIEEERAKILIPMELVRSRERALQKREKNFEILFQRFKRVYKKHYPESDLII